MSKPTPNSICGTVQLPKSPMLLALAVLDAAAADDASVVLATCMISSLACPSTILTCEGRTSTFDVALAVAVAVAVTESVASTVTVTVCAAQLSESELVAIATLVVAAAVAVAEVVAEICWVTPWSLTGAMLAKSVVIPNTALNASACPPVLAVTVSAAAFAVAQVCFARSLAPQKLTSWSHMNCVMISMFCAEPSQPVSYPQRPCNAMMSSPWS